MKSFITPIKLSATLFFIFLLAGCSQPERVVVDEEPTAAAPDTANEETTGEAAFRNLIIGEYNSVSTLDPLFAEDAATMRAVQLVYEGLVRFNGSGSIVAGLAKNWEVSSDSTEYTFRLRPDIFYHDSDAFSTGTGRRITSGDVKFVFERMARAGVPPKAAHMFMDIQGFDSYFSEQREVYNPSQRKINEISGIQAPDDSTIVFALNDPDPQFLEKLATPLAVIYPREAVGQDVESFSPVGAGPFQFSNRQSDSTLVFSKFQNYYANSAINLNRVDITPYTSESDLFKAMSAGDIHLIPQLGPQLMEEIIDTTGELNSSYDERYDLLKPGGSTEYVLRYNPNADLSSEDAGAMSRLAGNNSTYFNQFPDDLVTHQPNHETIDTTAKSSILNNQVLTVFSDDPFIRSYLGNLSTTLEQHDVQLQMMEIQAPSRQTGLFFTKKYPLIPDSRWNDYQELFRFRVQQATLQRSEIENLSFNNYLWYFDLRGVILPAAEKLN